MKFDRSDLDSIGFVLPVEEGSHRGQIPRTFYRFAAASHPVKIRQASGRNVVISEFDLLGVYSILRSKPASHRWKGGSVKAAVVSGKDGTGGNKVEAILSYLNKEGWIRYVELPKSGGQHGGSIIEVQYRRLPKSEAGKKRRIKFVAGKGWLMFEEDGKTEVKDAKSRRTFIVPDKDPDRPYGRDDEHEETNWQPYTRPSRERSSEERPSREPEPKERSTGDEYKDHVDKDHPIEGTPIVPQAEPGESDPFGSVGQEEEAESCDATTAGRDTVSHVPDSSPGEKIELMELVANLERLGKAASQSPEDRNRYELFLAREVSPRLKDSQIPERWTIPAAREWAQRSLKAHIILALVSNDSWPDGLLRTFGKHCGDYSTADLMSVLLDFDWDSRRVASLDGLVRNGKSRWDPAGWRQFMAKVCGGIHKTRLDTKLSIDLLHLPDAGSNCDLVSQWTEEKGSNPNPILMGDPSESQVFDWLYQVWHTGSPNSVRSFEGTFIEVRERHRNRVMRLVAISRQHLAVASSRHKAATEIWGIDWAQVREIHRQEVEALRMRAEIFGLGPVEPLFDLIECRMGFRLPSSIGAEAVGKVKGDVTTEQTPDFCSPARLPLSASISRERAAKPENPFESKFSLEEFMRQAEATLRGER